MSRVAYTNTVVCDGCGVEVSWTPILVKGRMYCCRECAEGRPCQCDFPPEESEGSDRVPAAVVYSTFE